MYVKGTLFERNLKECSMNNVNTTNQKKLILMSIEINFKVITKWVGRTAIKMKENEFILKTPFKETLEHLTSILYKFFHKID